MEKHQTMKSVKTLFVALFALFIFSCADNNNDKIESIDGIYSSLGYGRKVLIKDNEFKLFDVTNISCTSVLEGSMDIFKNNLSYKNDTMILLDGINIYKFVRTDSLPAICNVELTEEKQQDPIYNFEVLATIFEDHYAYFKLRNVNWDSLYTATKQKISTNTTDPELYIILEDMLDSFNDGHIGIEASDEVEESAESLRATKLKTELVNEKEYGDFEVAGLVANHFLGSRKKKLK